jgi:hypothetical protein
MTKPSIIVIPAASVEKGMTLWVKFGFRHQQCTVESIQPSPSNFRQFVIELKAPNDTLFTVTRHESDNVERI